jgi:hypothetical protein
MDYLRAGIHLAELYEQGRGVDMDVERAREILVDAANRGDLAAGYALGGLIERVDPGTHLPDESLDLYRSTAAAGYGPASLRMARIYLHGESVEQDIPKAMALLEKLSAEGYGPATAQLGDIYRDGDYQIQDYELAYSLFQRSLLQDHERAEMRIANMLRNGWGVEQDLRAARLIYTKFANQGVPEAAYSVARILEQEANDGEFPGAALPWYEAAAGTGHRPARLRLAVLALTGLGVPQDVPHALSGPPSEWLCFIEMVSMSNVITFELRLCSSWHTNKAPAALARNSVTSTRRVIRWFRILPRLRPFTVSRLPRVTFRPRTKWRDCTKNACATT